MEQPRFLLIDDDAQILALVSHCLRLEFPGCGLRVVGDTTAYADALTAGDFDLVITDYELPWTNGLAIVRELKGRWPERPVIMFTGSGCEEVAVEAMKAGLDDYVLKSPTRALRLTVAVRAALEHTRQRRQREEAETRYRHLFEEVPVGLFLVAVDGTILYANRALVRILGFPSREALLGLNLPSLFVHPEDRGRWLPADGGEVVRESRFPLCTCPGQTRWVESRVVRMTCSWGGSAAPYQGSLIDVTDRQRAEEEARDSRAKLVAIVDSAMDGIISIDDEQRVILFNAAAEQMFRIPAAEAQGQPLDRFIPERFRAAHREHVAGFGQTNVSRRQMGALGAVSGLRGDGEEFPVEASISQTELGGRKIYSVILRDISARVRAEQQIREQAALLNQVNDAILVRDLGGRIQFWNSGAERLYGWTAAEAVGRNAAELLGSADSPEFEEAMRSVAERGEWAGDLRQLSKDGKELVVESHWSLVRDAGGLPKAHVMINADATEKKKLQAQFLRAQRLESIGTLAGGIAHDLNNLLTPILMSIKLLRRDRPASERLGLLTTLQASAERGADMVRQLLSFAGGLEGQRVPLEPANIIKEVRALLEHTLPKSIAVRVALAEGLWSVRGDATQLAQVLMNLCVNARDAMPHGGVLTIGAQNLMLDGGFGRGLPNPAVRPHVLVTITDTGAGIRPEILDKIFDPFFTTKGPGKGTGLGLSTTLGIVKAHGGFIDVGSEMAKGTRFLVYLPAVTAAGPEQTAEQPAQRYTGRGETVLVVDDEAPIRETAARVLEANGFRVLTAADGREAFNLYRQHCGQIAVVLLDMLMPVLDGPATLRGLNALDPQVCVIATSGLRATGPVAEAVAAGAKAFLLKPYTAERLLETIGQVLATASLTRDGC